MEVYIAASRSDGSVAHVAFQTAMRAPGKPVGPWSLNEKTGWWEREASDVNIEFELARISRQWRLLDGLTLTGWRRISDAEHRMFEIDRDYRDALEDVNGAIQHNIVKARECHRSCLRHVNGEKLLLLDREWVDASAKNDKAKADTVDARRQYLRGLVNDPRIDAAQSIDELKRVVDSGQVLSTPPAR